MENLKMKIIEDINNSNLPLECIYYLIKDITRDVESAYYNTLNKERSKEEEGDKTE